MDLIQRKVSIKGGSHYESGKPCQDSSEVYSDGTLGIVTVADGHGGNRYIRSQVGSELATKTAVSVIKDVVANNSITALKDEEVNAFVREKVIRRIVSEWRNAVDEYDEDFPLTDEEMKFIRDKQIQMRDPYEKYGSTLSVGAMTDDFFLGIQIGDSPLTCTAEVPGETDMYTSEEPVPEDPQCMWNITTSICSPEAEKDFRYVLRRAPEDQLPLSVMASSDGLISTFDTADMFYEYCTYLVNLVDSDDDWSTVVGNLEARSKSNKEDDVSVAIMVRNQDGKEIGVFHKEPEPVPKPKMNEGIRFAEDEPEPETEPDPDTYTGSRGSLIYFHLENIECDDREVLEEDLSYQFRRFVSEGLIRNTAIVVTDSAPDAELAAKVRSAVPPGTGEPQYVYGVIGDNVSCEYLVKNMPEARILRFCCKYHIVEELLKRL